MKYGYLTFGSNDAQGKLQFGNLGDWYQTFAVQALYRKMGIPESEWVPIDRTAISDYRGERTRLFLQGCFLHLKGAPVFPVSPDIDPCFFGFHCLSVLDRQGIRSLPADTVIGCRDEATYQNVTRLGQKAFISGCITITLDKRIPTEKQTKVFLVDAPDSILPYIPSEMRSKVEYVSQSMRLENNWTAQESMEKLRAKAAETLAKYRDEAALVVTSRLHVASPCTAMGIPVILVRNYFDQRYAWIEKYLPLYTPDRFDKIRWDVQAPDIEADKQRILETAAAVVRRTPDFPALSDALHAYYLDRERGSISKPVYLKAYHFLQGIFPRTANFCREVLFQKFTVDTSRNKT